MESIKVQVPLDGANVNTTEKQPAQERESGFRDGVYQPPTKRVSIHQTRMPRTAAVEAETAPVWTENRHGGGGRFEYRPIERMPASQAEPTQGQAQQPPQSAQPNDAITQQLGNLNTAVEWMVRQEAERQGIQLDTRPKMPDPEDFDFYDPQEKAAFYQKNLEFVEAMVQSRLQSEFEPYRPALSNIQKGHEMQAEFDALVAQRGEDPNFKQVMSQALHLVADSNNTLSIAEAFAKADSRDNRPGERGGHLPEALRGRGKKIGQISLKDIVLHNQLSGRSGRR